MTEQEVINLINTVVKQNGNEEITGPVLNSVLLAMVEQPNDLIGDFNTTTISGTTIIDKINTLSGLIQNATGIKLHTGTENPNVNPPTSYNVADFYAETANGTVLNLWQYNGINWVNQANVINDNNPSSDTTYSSNKVIELLNSQDGVVNVTSISVAGNLVTIWAGSQWRINSVIYSNPNDVTIAVPYASIGYIRLDNILGNTSNTFELQQGIQTTGVAVAPLKPANKVVITQVSVNEDSVNSNYNNSKLKSEGGIIEFASTGNASNANVNTNASNINITNASSIGSLNIPAQFSYTGKRYIITNKRNVDVTIVHNGGDGNTKFNFPNDSNYILKPKESIEFMLNSDLTKLNFLGSNMTDEYYIFNSIISVTAAATPSYHYRGGNVMNLNLNSNSALTNPADLVGVYGTIVDFQIPYNCKLVHVNMVLPNVDSFTLSMVNDSSINPELAVKNLKYTGTGTGTIKTINQNTESLNLNFTEFHGVKLFCMASSATPASKGGYIQLKFKKI